MRDPITNRHSPPTAEPGPPPSGGKVHSKSSLEVRLKKLEHALDEIRAWCSCDWAADGANAEEVIAEIENVLTSVE